MSAWLYFAYKMNNKKYSVTETTVCVEKGHEHACSLYCTGTISTVMWWQSVAGAQSQDLLKEPGNTTWVVWKKIWPHPLKSLTIKATPHTHVCKVYGGGSNIRASAPSDKLGGFANKIWMYLTTKIAKRCQQLNSLNFRMRPGAWFKIFVGMVKFCFCTQVVPPPPLFFY